MLFEWWKNCDDWFDEIYANQVNSLFLEWWGNFYGYPWNYESTKDEQHEYFVRMAFAWMGWKSREEIRNAVSEVMKK